MAAYILKRLLLMLPTLLGVLLVTFVVIQFVPGGPVEQIRGRSCRARLGRRGAAAAAPATAGGRASTRSGSRRSRRCTASTSRRTSASGRCSGLRALRPGQSFFQHKDVWELIKEKLPVSISLGLWTFFISYLIAVPLGVAKAVRAGTASTS